LVGKKGKTSDTLGAVKKFLTGSMKQEVSNRSMTRLGRRGQRPILVKLTSFSLKLEVLRNTRNLAGSQIRADKDFCFEIRKTGRCFDSIPKGCQEKWTHGIFEKGKLVVEGRTYDLYHEVKNIQLGVEGDGLDIPVRNNMEGSEEISQHRTVSTGSGFTSRKVLQKDKTIWKEDESE
jgi:hypothetical protein